MNIKLQAQARVKQEKLSSDFLPGIVYAPGFENVMIKLKVNDFVKAFNQAGESNLIDLNIDGQEIPVLVKDTQKDVVKDFFIHVDFYKVDMNKEVSADISLEFVGESKAVKELGALLVKNIDFVSVECLPKDLVDHIDVDISSLIEFGDNIQVKDLSLPQGIKVLNNLDDAVVSVVEPKEEKEVPVEASVPEVAGAPVKEGSNKETSDKETPAKESK
jgi:large subunit ribosomal protein L25